MASIENKPQVNHIDGNKQNNSFTDLEWVTDEENKDHNSDLSELAKFYKDKLDEFLEEYGVY